jgi:opacity protein-like surface antigen/outer membrane protease
MNTHKKNLLRASLFVLVSLSVAATIVPSIAGAADLPPPAPTWTWTGLYFGGSAGAAAGTATFSDPRGNSVFGDKVNTSAFLAGLQVGYNWQVAPRWVVGVEGNASYLDSNGNFTCMQSSGAIIGANCQVSPRVLASLTGRVGFLVDPLGRTLLYGKGGGAWMDSDISIIPNLSFTDGVPAGVSASAQSSAWGGTVGGGIERALTPAWSVLLEYDYYRFAATSVSVPATLSFNGGTGAAVAGNRASVTPDMQVVKLALNYHWDQDPRITWADAAPVFGATAMPLKARPAPAPFTGWEFDTGGRYWYSSGREKNTSGTSSLTSQLDYSNLTGQSGEFFARIDTPSRLFVKGFVGSGGLNGGTISDEDWGNAAKGAVGGASGYMLTRDPASGWFNYAAGDVGYDLLHDRNYKFGAFVGYSYLRQNITSTGCMQVQPQAASCLNAGDNPNRVALTQDETWQSLRVGVSAVARIWDRWGINGDVAYLPFGKYDGLDIHSLRTPVTLFPQNGTSRGVQAELILTYLVTDNLELGIGGRYWALWTAGAEQGQIVGFTVSPPGPYTASTERFGGFVQASYRFNAFR